MLAHRMGEIGNKDIQRYRNEHARDIGSLLRKFVTVGWLRKTGQGSGTRYQWTISSSEHLAESSEHLPESSEHSPEGSEHSPEDQEQILHQIAASVQVESKKIPKAKMEQIILELCAIDWLTLRKLSYLLNRKPDYLRNHFITPMLKEGRLEPKIPEVANHPQQAYRKKS